MSEWVSDDLDRYREMEGDNNYNVTINHFLFVPYFGNEDDIFRLFSFFYKVSFRIWMKKNEYMNEIIEFESVEVEPSQKYSVRSLKLITTNLI